MIRAIPITTIFASTNSIIGEPALFPTEENPYALPPLALSNEGFDRVFDPTKPKLLLVSLNPNAGDCGSSTRDDP